MSSSSINYDRFENRDPQTSSSSLIDLKICLRLNFFLVKYRIENRHRLITMSILRNFNRFWFENLRNQCLQKSNTESAPKVTELRGSNNQMGEPMSF